MSHDTSEDPKVAEVVKALEDVGAKVFFEKALTSSDVGGTGRVVIPKAIAEQYFPRLDNPSGLPVRAVDTLGRDYSFKFRFWTNNQGRRHQEFHGLEANETGSDESGGENTYGTLKGQRDASVTRLAEEMARKRRKDSLVREALRMLVDATSKTLADQVILARVCLTSVLMTSDKLVDDSGEVQAAYATLEVDSSGQDARRLVRLAFLTASISLSDGVRYNDWLLVMQRSFLDSELPNQDVPLSFLLQAVENMKAFATSSSLTFLLDQSVGLAAQPPLLS
eukprot:gene25188-10825_t